MTDSVQSDQPTTEQTPRSWKQFGIRSLLVFTIFAAIFFAWFGWKLRKGDRQREVVTKEFLENEIYYDYEIVNIQEEPSGAFLPVNPDPPYPKFLLRWLGKDFFCEVDVVSLRPSRRWDSVDTSKLKAVPEIKSLKAVWMVQVEFPETWFSKLTDLSELQVISVHLSNIADEDLFHFQHLRRLEFLDLINSQIKGNGLEHLSQLPKLKKVWLRNNPHLTDVGMVHLGNCNSLEELDVSQCPITDAGISHLASLKHLKAIAIGNHPTDEEGKLLGLPGDEWKGSTDLSLQSMSKIPSLEVIDCSLAKITPNGLKDLAQLPKLHTLVVSLQRGTDVDAVVEAISQLPTLKKCEFRDCSGIPQAELDKIEAKLSHLNVSY